MTIEQIREMLQSPEYEFLRSNEHLKDKIIFLTLGGSYSYGTNVETSDVDIRGCALNSRSDLLGLSNFEQVVHTGTDTTVYSFNKLVSLLLNCNPNTIEMLGCRPEQYMVCTDIGREMIENRKLFLSKRAVNSFGGYANQQLRRLENALARDKLPQARKEEQMKFVYSVLKHFAKGTDAVLSYKLCEPFKTMGSVSIEAKQLEFDNPEWFARAAEFASNTEVYPLTKNRIRLTFTFHGITTPIE